MAQERRPASIPNPEAKAWHGDGTASERMWESSTPPHHNVTEDPGRPQPPGVLAYQRQQEPRHHTVPGPHSSAHTHSLPTGTHDNGTGTRLSLNTKHKQPYTGESPPRAMGAFRLWDAMHYFTPKRCATSNKIMYHDKAQAQRAADQSLIERGSELWVYRCEYCYCWHLTHRDPQSSYRHVPLNQALKPHSRKKGYKPRRR